VHPEKITATKERTPAPIVIFNLFFISLPFN
jgi:hypothetical protein